MRRRKSAPVIRLPIRPVKISQNTYCWRTADTIRAFDGGQIRTSEYCDHALPTGTID